ncbi:MAG: ROK family transcriptional regulator [Actinobacteria bacterium]|nr:MAG: ROK family transcriptional regulator [Actinomycetota bacterium]
MIVDSHGLTTDLLHLYIQSQKLSTYAVDRHKSLWHAGKTVLDHARVFGSDPDSPGDLLRLIRTGSARTRGELVEATGLARSTVAQRIEGLMAAGLIVEIGGAPSTGGRPPSLLGFNGEAGLVLAADLGASHSRVIVADLGLNSLAEVEADLDIDEGPEIVLGWLIDTFDRLLAEAGRDRGDVLGIGIGVPGPVDFERGVAVNPPIMAGWHEFRIVDRVRESFDVPVLVDNDVNIMALGEHWAMEPKVDDFVFIKVGTGIGSGLILGGRLHRGADGAAGDIGHVQATSSDAICRCGNQGCLEASAGGAALASKLAKLGHDAKRSSDVTDLVEKGNKDAIVAVRDAGRLIGEVVASLVNLLNPSQIMIGGNIAKAEQHLLAGIREVVYSRSTTLSTTNLQITGSALGDRSGVTGAAAMAIDYLLRPGNIDRVLEKSAVSS